MSQSLYGNGNQVRNQRVVANVVSKLTCRQASLEGPSAIPIGHPNTSVGDENAGQGSRLYQLRLVSDKTQG